jgi:hypothetical protein
VQPWFHLIDYQRFVESDRVIRVHPYHTLGGIAEGQCERFDEQARCTILVDEGPFASVLLTPRVTLFIIDIRHGSIMGHIGIVTTLERASMSKS